MPRIEELWAWVMTDPQSAEPDDEGVPAYLDPETMMWQPLMGADKDRALSLRTQAELMAKIAGRPLRLVRSTGLEVVETINPPGENGGAKLGREE